MSGIVQLIGSQVLTKNGKESTASLAEPGKVIGLYFSAHWCPPCRGFTPQLAKWYTDFKKTEKGKNFEIVFVSSDRDEASFKEYFGEMPWVALPYDERDKKGELGDKFGVRGIPTFVLVDGATGEVLNLNARGKIAEDPTGENFPWKQ